MAARKSTTKTAEAESEATEERALEPSGNGRQLVPTVQGTALDVYQDREIVNELMSRLMSFHPAAKEVGKAGMLMAAQLALLMGASPLPSTNEIHIWKDNRGNVQVSPGINYWRRRARQWLGIWWVERPRPMTELELREYEISEGELGAICKGAAMRDVEPLLSRGIPIKDVLAAKTLIGLGTVDTGKTQYGSYKEQKQGRPLIWTAVKRCETDLLKQLFPYEAGENFQPGAGLQVVNGGGYAVDDQSRHWGELSLQLSAQTVIDSDDSIDDINEDLFGSKAGYGQIDLDLPPDDDKEEFVEVESANGIHMVPSSIIALGNDAIREYVADQQAKDEAEYREEVTTKKAGKSSR